MHRTAQELHAAWVLQNPSAAVARHLGVASSLRSCKTSRSDSPITRKASANSWKSKRPLPWASISPNAASPSWEVTLNTSSNFWCTMQNLTTLLDLWQWSLEVWCRRTIIPGKIFTSLAKFQRIVSVDDFRLPIRLQELLQALLCFMRSFCFARIRLDPLGGQVLHHDCISMIVSRFAIFTENLKICCYQVTRIFCTRYGFANASSARCPCNFGRLTDLAISVFGEMSINIAYPKFLTTLGCGL